jgi:hypothetical protein
LVAVPTPASGLGVAATRLVRRGLAAVLFVCDAIPITDTAATLSKTALTITGLPSRR